MPLFGRKKQQANKKPGDEKKEKAQEQSTHQVTKAQTTKLSKPPKVKTKADFLKKFQGYVQKLDDAFSEKMQTLTQRDQESQISILSSDTAFLNLRSNLVQFSKNVSLRDAADGARLFHNVDGIFRDVKSIEKRFRPDRLAKKGITDLNNLAVKIQINNNITLDDIRGLDLIKSTERDLRSIEKRITNLLAIAGLVEEEKSELTKALDEVRAISTKATDALTSKGKEIATKFKAKVDEAYIKTKFRENLIEFQLILEQLLKDQPNLSKTNKDEAQALITRAKEILERNGPFTSQLQLDQIQDAAQLYADAHDVIGGDNVQHTIIGFSMLLYHEKATAFADHIVPPLTLYDDHKEDKRMVEQLREGTIPDRLHYAVSSGVEKYRELKSELKTDEGQGALKPKGFFKGLADKIKNKFTAIEKALTQLANPPVVKGFKNLSPEALLLMHVNTWKSEHDDRIFSNNPAVLHTDPSEIADPKEKFYYLTMVLSALAEEKSRLRKDNSTNPERLQTNADLMQSITKLENQIYAIAHSQGWVQQSGSLYLMQQARAAENKKDYVVAGRLEGTAKHLATQCCGSANVPALQLDTKGLIPLPGNEGKQNHRFFGNMFSKHTKEAWGQRSHKAKAIIAEKIPPHIIRHLGLETLSHVRKALDMEQNAGRAKAPEKKQKHSRAMQA